MIYLFTISRTFLPMVPHFIGNYDNLSCCNYGKSWLIFVNSWNNILFYNHHQNNWTVAIKQLKTNDGKLINSHHSLHDNSNFFIHCLYFRSSEFVQLFLDTICSPCRLTEPYINRTRNMALLTKNITRNYPRHLYHLNVHEKKQHLNYITFSISSNKDIKHTMYFPLLLANIYWATHLN